MDILRALNNSVESLKADSFLEIDKKVIIFFESSESMHHIRDNTVNFIFTSPPYWHLKDYGHEQQIGRRDEPYEIYLSRLKSVFTEAFRVSKDNAILAVNVGNRRVNGVFYTITFDLAYLLKEIGWYLIDDIIWYIPNALPQPRHYLDKLFDNKYEHVLIFSKNYRYDYTFNKIRIPQKYLYKDPRTNKKNPLGRCIGNVWKIPAYRPPTIKQMNYHMAAFPEELAYALIYAFSKPGDIILDPFVGSGTTLKVSYKTGRLGIGYEINHNFRDLICTRILIEDWREPQLASIDPLGGEILQKSSSGRKRSKKSVHTFTRNQQAREVDEHSDIQPLILEFLS